MKWNGLNKYHTNMKKIILLLLITVLFSGCLMVPSKFSVNQRRLWIHQNHPKKYYYKQYPNRQERVKRGRNYIPYFRPGRY